MMQGRDVGVCDGEGCGDSWGGGGVEGGRGGGGECEQFGAVVVCGGEDG